MLDAGSWFLDDGYRLPFAGYGLLDLGTAEMPSPA
jgi:hypothetical protein